MDLFIVRHAVAVPRREGLEDAARRLTTKGAARFRRVVRGLAACGVELERVWHSPWRRAVETAELMSPVTTGKMVAAPLLAQAPTRRLLGELRGEAVAVVGHDPWLSELVAWLVVGDREAFARFPLKKGGVAWLRGDPRPAGMQVYALLTPKILELVRER